MSPEATAAHEYCKEYKKNKLNEHMEGPDEI